MKAKRAKAVDKRDGVKVVGLQPRAENDLHYKTSEEMALNAVKSGLGGLLRQYRQEQHLSQTALAKYLRSSQSRVAKMEAGDPSVSIDLLLRALYRLGVSKFTISLLISTPFDAEQEQILQAFRGYVEEIEGETAYTTLVDAAGNEAEAGFEANRLTEKGIAVGDAFRYLILQIGADIVARFEAVSQEEVSERSWRETQAQIQSLIGDYAASHV